ncbi:MAG: hypothetical protein WD810_04570 [Solirubrobacterales bacterium]
MTRKLMVLGLAAFLAIVVAVPVLAQTTTVSPKVSQDLAVRALAKARLALLTARSAKGQSRVAARTAQAALNAANEAKGAAAAAQVVVDTSRVQAGLAAGGATTEAEEFVALPGGPSVTVTVTASGLIEVWAQAKMSESGAVSLFEDGQAMPGQSEACAPLGGGGALFSGDGVVIEGSITAGTPATLPFCSTEGAPGAVLFQTSPGQHSYELRYASCGCGEGEGSPVTFSQRRLFVAPRP